MYNVLMNTYEQAELFQVAQVADICGVSKETVRRWDKSGKLKAHRADQSNYREYTKDQLLELDEAKVFFSDESPKESILSKQAYSLIELFAGAGGLAIGLEQCGFESKLLNELDKSACKTLRKNRPQWNVVEGSIDQIDFREFKGKVDVVTGGFPCQAFSYAGKKLGFEDTRGTLFFEFARCITEVQPKVFLAENVRGLLRHDEGRTLETMVEVLTGMGYHVYEPRVLKAIHHKVPQKRERLIIVGVKKELKGDYEFEWPTPTGKIYTVKDALKKGELFSKNVPKSAGQTYPEHKKKVMDLVPPGGYWRDLPIDIQKSYMMKSFYLGGGKTGIARRMSWDEPSLTLTTSPAQKQTERCHPVETRPFTTREYARIQTFPDEWKFEGSQSAVYKQIGNAVPVNLAIALGISLRKLLDAVNDQQVISNELTE